MIDYLEANGPFPDLKLSLRKGTVQWPTFDGDITWEEGYRVHAFWMAHYIYIETKRIVPWSLNDYSVKELDYIFSREYVLEEGTGTSINGVSQRTIGYQVFIMDNPGVLFRWAKSKNWLSGKTNPNDLLDELYKFVRSYFIHESRQFEDKPYDLYEALRRKEIHCLVMARIGAVFSRAFNIPAKPIVFGRHSGLYWPTLKGYVGHCDWFFQPPELFNSFDHVKHFVIQERWFEDFILHNLNTAMKNGADINEGTDIAFKWVYWTYLWKFMANPGKSLRNMACFPDDMIDFLLPYYKRYFPEKKSGEGEITKAEKMIRQVVEYLERKNKAENWPC